MYISNKFLGDVDLGDSCQWGRWLRLMKALTSNMSYYVASGVKMQKAYGRRKWEEKALCFLAALIPGMTHITFANISLVRISYSAHQDTRLRLGRIISVWMGASPVIQVSLLLKVWSMDQQHQHHLRTCQKCIILFC